MGLRFGDFRLRLLDAAHRGTSHGPFDHVAALPPETTREFFREHGPGLVIVGADNDFGLISELGLAVPEVLELPVAAGVDLAFLQLGGGAVGHGDDGRQPGPV